MNKNEFKLFCRQEFEKYGFKKIKKVYYLKGPKDVLCGIDLQKSTYGAVYYVNYLFFIGDFKCCDEYPSVYDLDLQGRVSVLSKTQKSNGKHFMTGQIEYEQYTKEELKPYFDKEFMETILPPIYQGKEYILTNLNKKYFLSLRQDEVLKKLVE